MKIRNPTIIRWIGFFGAVIIRLWIGTLAFRQRAVGVPRLPNVRGLREPHIYAFWHENILVPCYAYRGLNIQVLISEHADGEMIAQVCQHIGYGTVRGSKTRGGMKALRELIRAARSRHLAVMPDGPRGPRRHVELGLIYLAARTGLPIVLMGVGHDRPWRLKTWDRFCLPRPFSKVLVLSSDAIHIPADAGRDELEVWRQKIEHLLSELTDRAERLAAQ